MVRLGGLATGQDTQAIIDAILEVERRPIQLLNNEAAIEEEKLVAWNAVDDAVSDLYSKTSKLNSFLTWRQTSVTSTTSSVATASAGTAAALGSYSMNVTQLAQSHRVGSDSQTSATADLTLDGNFVVNGETITVSSGDTLEDIRDAINTASANMSDGVTASIINTTLVIERNDTGDTDITITDGTNTVAASLGILTGTSIKNELQTSEDMAGTLNGIDISGSANTNLTSIVEGMTFNIKSTGTTNLTVARDTSAIKTGFEELIESYNSLMELLEDTTAVNLSESGELSETGVLQGNQILSQIKLKARSILTQDGQPELTAPYHNLQAVGIWTESRANRLTIIDEDKLDSVLTNNFDEIEDLVRDFDGGIIREFNSYLDTLQSPVDGTIARQIEQSVKYVQSRDDKIRDIELKLVARETQLWERFSQMESAVAQIQSQSNFVLSSLGR